VDDPEQQRGEHHRRPDHPSGGPIPQPQELGPQEDEEGHQAQPEQDLLVDPGADGGQKTLLRRRDAGFLERSLYRFGEQGRQTGS
jgi:hypothetical protein